MAQWLMRSLPMPKKRVLDWPYLITQKSILSYYYFLWNREDKHKLIGGYEWYIWENWNRQQITITKFEPMSLLLSVRHYDHWAQSSIRFSSCSKEFFDKAPPLLSCDLRAPLTFEELERPSSVQTCWMLMFGLFPTYGSSPLNDHPYLSTGSRLKEKDSF